jgi:hypothetical protein
VPEAGGARSVSLACVPSRLPSLLKIGSPALPRPDEPRAMRDRAEAVAAAFYYGGNGYYRPSQHGNGGFYRPSMVEDRAGWGYNPHQSAEQMVW